MWTKYMVINIEPLSISLQFGQTGLIEVKGLAPLQKFKRLAYKSPYKKNLWLRHRGPQHGWTYRYHNLPRAIRRGKEMSKEEATMILFGDNQPMRRLPRYQTYWFPCGYIERILNLWPLITLIAVIALTIAACEYWL